MPFRHRNLIQLSQRSLGMVLMLFAAFATGDRISLANPNPPHSHSPANSIQLGQELDTLQRIPDDQRSPQQQKRLIELIHQEQAHLKEFQTFIDSPDIQKSREQLSRSEQTQRLDLSRLNQIRRELRERNAVLLYPLVLDDRLELLIVTPNAPPIRHRVDVSKIELNQAVFEFRQALQAPNRNPKPQAQKLYDWLIKPLEADLKLAKPQTILFSPDSSLRYIPIAALYDGKQWFAERYQTNHITTLSSLNWKSQPTDSIRILAGAFTDDLDSAQNSDRTYEFPKIPFAQQEVDAIAAVFPKTTILSGSAFTPDNLLPQLQQHSILHLATHTVLKPGQLMDSFIVFGNGVRVTLQEVKNWDLSNLDLVILSGSETAVGGFLGNGEELLGMSYQFQNSGARAVMASLWQINDHGTQVLMQKFYTALSQGQSQAASLQQAQIEMITNNQGEIDDAVTSDRLDHPYYWAPFILTGNGF